MDAIKKARKVLQKQQADQVRRYLDAYEALALSRLYRGRWGLDVDQARWGLMHGAWLAIRAIGEGLQALGGRPISEQTMTLLRAKRDAAARWRWENDPARVGH